jgi:hypothetical protein
LKKINLQNKELLAYIVGVAIGDGNLSRVSEAIRLRITCDTKYPFVIANTRTALQNIFPDNKVSIVYREKTCNDKFGHTIRISKNTEEFIKLTHVSKE